MLLVMARTGCVRGQAPRTFSATHPRETGHMDRAIELVDGEQAEVGLRPASTSALPGEECGGDESSRPRTRRRADDSLSTTASDVHFSSLLLSRGASDSRISEVTGFTFSSGSM